MFSTDLLRDLLRHMEWADAQVWAAVLSTNSQDERLVELLTHTHFVQHAFLTVWQGGDVNALLARSKEFTTLPQLRSFARSYYPAASSFVDGLSPQRLNEVVTPPWSAQIAEHLGREPGPTTLGETCFQVTSHSTYHRGQVNARLRELGTAPPNVDYIAWLWLGRPPAEWNT